MVNRRTNPKPVHLFLALMALAIPSAAVRGRASEAVSTQDAEPVFPGWGLLPRSPLSQAVRAQDPQPEAHQVQEPKRDAGAKNQAAASAQAGKSKPPEKGTHSASAPSPMPPGQPAPQGEKGKRERGETAASQTSPVHPSAGASPGGQALAQGYNGQPTTDHGQTTAQSPSAQPVAQRVQEPKRDAGPKNQAGASALVEKSKPPEKGAGLASATLQAAPIQPSAIASPGVQPAVQRYNGPRTTDHGQTTVKSPGGQPVILQVQEPKRYARAESQPPSPSRSTKSKPFLSATGSGSVASQEPAGQFPAKSGDVRALRDPFRLPPPPRAALEENDSKLAVNRPPGPRGLLIGQLKLRGVVRDSTTHKMIALVTNSNNRAYFLREGEAVYDGVMSKITPDAVYFKQNVFDAKREVHSREVVKTLNPAAGEVR